MAKEKSFDLNKLHKVKVNFEVSLAELTHINNGLLEVLDSCICCQDCGTRVDKLLARVQKELGKHGI